MEAGVADPLLAIQGLSKSMVFGMIIALIGCYKGLTCREGAEGVGRATTNAVVAGSVVVLAVDFLVTKLLFMVMY